MLHPIEGCSSGQNVGAISTFTTGIQMLTTFLTFYKSFKQGLVFNCYNKSMFTVWSTSCQLKCYQNFTLKVLEYTVPANLGINTQPRNYSLSDNFPHLIVDLIYNINWNIAALWILENSAMGLKLSFSFKVVWSITSGMQRLNLQTKTLLMAQYVWPTSNTMKAWQN